MNEFYQDPLNRLTSIVGSENQRPMMLDKNRLRLKRPPAYFYHNSKTENG